MDLRTVIKNLLPDSVYLRLSYRKRLGKKLNLKNPRTFNEKLQWLKLYDRRPEYTNMVDKLLVRDYIAEKLGEKYLIPLLGVWNRFDDIDFDLLPNQFVLKCTHDSGGLVVVKDKAMFDRIAAKKIIENSLQTNYYYAGREWPYKNVKPRIIAEAYMEDLKTSELRDYKFLCIDGEPKIMFVVSERHTQGEETKFDFFDMDYNHLNLSNGHPHADVPPQKPETFELMKEMSAKLSKGIPQLRVDFYEVNGQAYFGEITFFWRGGMIPFDPPQWDEILGAWIDLSKVKRNP